MNTVTAHLEGEVVQIALRHKETDMLGKDYRVLEIGDRLSLYMNEEQLEALFDAIDERLHTETYLQLQDRAFSTEVGLNNANELIEQLEDNLADAI